MRPHPSVIENQSRDTAGRRKIRAILETDPKQLLVWPPIVMWNLLGWIVRPNDRLDDATALQCDYDTAMRENAIWTREGGERRYDRLFPERAAGVAKRRAAKARSAV
jgi:hypothetical protein